MYMQLHIHAYRRSIDTCTYTECRKFQRKRKVGTPPLLMRASRNTIIRCIYMICMIYIVYALMYITWKHR
jgi:hypothetical protein